MKNIDKLEFSRSPTEIAGSLNTNTMRRRCRTGHVQPGVDRASGEANSVLITTLRLTGRWSQALNRGAWQEDERQWAVET